MSSSAGDGGILMTMHRLSQGGADRVAVLLANGFVQKGIPTRFVLLRDQGEAERELLDLLHPDVSITSAGPAIGSRHLELVRGQRFIQREIVSHRPAVVLASSSNMGLVTGLASKVRRDNGPRFAMKLTNPVVRPRDRGALRTLYRHKLYAFIFNQYDLVLTLSEAERLSLLEIYPAAGALFRTVPNPYISSEMLQDPPRRRPAGPCRVLTAARMMPQKRLDVLLQAFARTSLPDSRLTILGDGPLRPALERLAQSLGIADRVEMPGFVDDVLPWLRRTDLFALSSDYEGLPAVILEAFACNVPVVTTDCFAGARQMFSEIASCAVTPVGDPAAFAAAIDRCLTSARKPEDLRKIAEGFGIEASIAAHIRALDHLMR
ncbi:glycosyltransferase [Sphingomonas sp.]|uniref:glycosyltransferase n=1 Tax=Sphingomonas sp. TaxID=28214 RepID=UPI00286D200E|nr:glycosyltransferase [Sphingomonas sp.]